MYGIQAIKVGIRDSYAISKNEKDYILRVLNPNNPFIVAPLEEISYSKKETGRLIITEVETIRTIFHYVKRSNRTK